MLNKISPIVFVLFLCSCGVDSNDSTIVTPADTVTATATVTFDASNATIEVIKADDDPKSEVFEECTFSMDPITGSLSYDLVDQDNLKLGTGSFTYKRALKSAKTKAGVPDRIFSVWGTPDKVQNGVTMALELEIEPQLLTFRMTCTA